MHNFFRQKWNHLKIATRFKIFWRPHLALTAWIWIPTPDTRKHLLFAWWNWEKWQDKSPELLLLATSSVIFHSLLSAAATLPGIPRQFVLRVEKTVLSTATRIPSLERGFTALKEVTRGWCISKRLGISPTHDHQVMQNFETGTFLDHRHHHHQTTDCNTND